MKKIILTAAMAAALCTTAFAEYTPDEARWEKYAENTQITSYYDTTRISYNPATDKVVVWELATDKNSEAFKVFKETFDLTNQTITPAGKIYIYARPKTDAIVRTTPATASDIIPGSFGEKLATVLEGKINRDEKRADYEKEQEDKKADAEREKTVKKGVNLLRGAFGL